MSTASNRSSDTKYFEAGLKTVASKRRLREKLSELLRLSAEAAGSRMGGIWLLDHDRLHLQAAVTFGIPDSYVACWRTVPVGSGVCGVVVQTGISDYVEDMTVDPRFCGADCSLVRAGFSVPIQLSSGKVIGTLAHHFAVRFRPTQTHIERNKAFATLIAAAVDSDDLFNEDDFNEDDA